MSTHTVNINGIDLVYDKEGSGPAVLFLHGGNVSGIEWEPVIPHLVGSYTCYRLDQRGHGRSGRDPQVDYSFGAFAKEAAEFLALVSGPAVVVGHSQGGHAAFGAAALRPDLVKAIYSEDAIPSIGVPAMLGQTWVVRIFPALYELAAGRERDRLGLMEFAARLGETAPLGVPFFEQLDPPGLVALARSNYNTDPTWYSFAQNIERFGWTDAEAERLNAAVNCPVHLARGNPRMGGLISDEAFAGVDGWSNYSTTYFEDTGHNIQRSLPREFIADLKAFLAGLPA